MFRFEDPWVLGLLVLIPVLSWVRFRRRPRPATLRYAALDAVREAGGGVAGWLPHVPSVLRGLVVVATVVALARPQTGVSSESVLTEGIDILMALDVSSSMLAEDLEPNRLEAAKSVAAEFVAGRANDRVGLVAFAGEAFTQAPLTIDRGVVTGLLDELDVGMIEDGTAVGMGLATAVKRLQASPSASQVVVLLTDGRNNRGEIGPVTAAQMAQALGVRVYTIGVGTEGRARVPVNDAFGGPQYVTIPVDIDESTLREVAEGTGGRYFRATDNESLAAIYAEIDELERTEVEVENYTTWEERFGAVLLLALGLLVLELVLRQTLLRRLP
ncbi:VWA domain-containing protein [Gaopeijia maritima]|uniref:vWA domain-containing protein n=1 Tax=Gaopeijia maritima TaxID=3119007 RepID=UPI00324792A1